MEDLGYMLIGVFIGIVIITVIGLSKIPRCNCYEVDAKEYNMEVSK